MHALGCHGHMLPMAASRITRGSVVDTRIRLLNFASVWGLCRQLRLDSVMLTRRLASITRDRSNMHPC